MPDPPALPPWPTNPPRAGAVLLRAFCPGQDVAMVRDLATDPYVPLIGSLPANANETQAGDWITRNLGRWREGTGFSFAIAEGATGEAVGAAGLWLTELSQGRATAGYSIAPRHRGHGHATDALTALTGFAWTLAAVHRVELYIEPRHARPRSVPPNMPATCSRAGCADTRRSAVAGGT